MTFSNKKTTYINNMNKKYQVTIVENSDGSVEVERVFSSSSEEANRTSLKPIDKRSFTKTFLNKVSKFQTK